MNISDELNDNNAEKNSKRTHIGRESHVVPGRFGEPLKVTNAQYSQGNASAHPTHPILLLLHGWGSNEEDLLDLLRVVAPYNDAIALRAPLKLAQGAYSWFHDAVPQREDLDYDMYAAAVAINEWVHENIPENRDIVPFGFSQGAALAVHVLRLNPARYRASVSLSGFIAPNIPTCESEIILKDDDLAERNIPVFFGYGLEDDVIAPYEFSAAAAWLEEHTWLEEHRYRGLDHAVDMNEIGDIRKWFVTHDISSGLM
ncbi:phospholipase/carboxylesterase [Gardnerella vaginalis]|uniref:Phospholipase/carboxylesterase n=1 Tax=Gardnerella vaginalis TaxID=2702 RepID=A0A135ZC17_GARVA|nr:esterase [Gardnerella vaginalis]KXI19233.1 phospholipase/carboxylesterase [Gardnerella vaginalis]